MDRRRFAVVILTSAIGACAPVRADVAPDQAPTGTSSRDIVLTPGRPVRVDGTRLAVTLHAIVDDSRCPEGVTCIWAGDVSARIGIDDGEGSAREVTLHLNTSERDIVHGDLRLTLMSVTPYPKADEKIAPESYRATMRVERQ